MLPGVQIACSMQDTGLRCNLTVLGRETLDTNLMADSLYIPLHVAALLVQ